MTGSYPLDGGTGTEIRRLHDQGTSRRPLRDVRPDLPDAFIRAVERALAEDPRQRFGRGDPRKRPRQHDRRPARSRTWRHLAPIAAAVVIVAGLTALAASRGWIFGRTSARQRVSPHRRQSDARLRRAAATGYRIDAAFYRERNDSDEQLGPDDRLVPGDELSFHVRVSAPTYVSLMRTTRANRPAVPAPRSVAVESAFTRAESPPAGERSETTTTLMEGVEPGGREHFLLVASRERSPEFEKVISALPPPVLNRLPSSERLSADALSTLRSVGSLAVSSVAPAGTSLLLHQQPEYSTLFVPGEQTVEWHLGPTGDVRQSDPCTRHLAATTEIGSQAPGSGFAGSEGQVLDAAVNQVEVLPPGPVVVGDFPGTRRSASRRR